MPDERSLLVDQDARDTARHSLGETLFVEAGAGTGKTTVLVDRVLSLLRSGVSPIELAIITFTRAAASELQERIRARVEQAIAQETLDDTELDNLRSALDGMDFAAIQTIDSFALSLLRERPLDAGLPPVIEPLDEVDSAIQFDERWAEWLDSELGAEEDTDLAGWLERAMRLGLSDPLSTMKDIARQFHENYDVIDGLDFREPYKSDVDVVGEFLQGVKELWRMSRLCADPTDKLYQHLQDVLPRCDEIAATRDPVERAIHLVDAPKITYPHGKRTNWPDPSGGKGATCIEVVRDKLTELQCLKDAHAEAMRAEALGELANQVAGFVLRYAEDRRREGRAEFHDMLVWAAEMLENSPDALRHFRERYTHILIDEFQDTDPLQVKLAFLLTCRNDSKQPDPGALFVVGDPKQSIYGWRRADIRVMTEAQQRMTGGREPQRLVQNFRSHRRILDWVNGVFGEWIGTEGSQGQAEYVPLETDREPPAPDWGAFYIGGLIEGAAAQGVRSQEARHIAEACRGLVDGGWHVRDAGHSESGEPGTPRPARYGDIAILMRNRTGIRELQQALEDEGVPYTLSGQSLAYSTQEVRDIVSALGAVDDPSDEVALVAALRSPVYGCSDVDLWRWRQAGATFSYLNDQPDAAAEAAPAIADAMCHLRELHYARMTETTSALLERLVRDRRLRELALDDRWSRQRWDRMEMLLEDARSLEQSGRPGLRHFISWVNDRAENRTRVAEPAGADPEEDAVKVMTVHAAKGLEFPIVVLTGINSDGGGGRKDSVIFDYRAAQDPGTGHQAAGIRVGSQTQGTVFQSRHYEDIQVRSASASEAEDARLMYVACTRAMDHLVVSLYRKQDKNKDDTYAGLFDRYGEHLKGDLWLELPEPPQRTEEHPDPPGRIYGHPEALEGGRNPGDLPTGDDDTPEQRQQWLDARQARIKQASTPGVVTASSLHRRSAPTDTEGPPQPDDAESPLRESQPWVRGRDARPLGRAVHAVLQDVDLNDHANLADLAAKHAEAHAIPAEADTVRSLAEATLGTDVMRRAAEAARASRCWREVYVGSALEADAPAAEGFIDLVFEQNNGTLAVVDYKTDRVRHGETLEQAAAPYEAQLGLYVAAVEHTTGLTVGEAALVFATRAREGIDAVHHLPNPQAAAQRAVALATERPSH